MELEPKRLEGLLDTWPIARLATLDAEGAPHQIPIVFARSAGALWSPIDGKPKRTGTPGKELARIANLRRDGRVSLLLDDYAEDWTRLWWLRVVGVGEVVAAEGWEGDAVLRSAVAALEHKYPQYRETELFSGLPTLVRIRVRSVRSWRAAPDASAEEAGS